MDPFYLAEFARETQRPYAWTRQPPDPLAGVRFPRPLTRHEWSNLYTLTNYVYEAVSESGWPCYPDRGDFARWEPWFYENWRRQFSRRYMTRREERAWERRIWQVMHERPEGGPVPKWMIPEWETDEDEDEVPD